MHGGVSAAVAPQLANSGPAHLTPASPRRPGADTPWMRELSVAEQRYQAVLAVIGDGLSISQVAEKVGVRGSK
jgi:DNA-binding NarL/FixJ family response regulator